MTLFFYQAYKIGFYGPKRVWFFMGYYSTLFWKNNLNNVDCTAAQMSAAIEGSLLIYNLVVSKDEQRGIANLTSTYCD